MRITSATNLQWANTQRTIIDCVVQFDTLQGSFPMAVSASGDTVYLQQLWSDILVGRYGPVAPYSAPVLTVDQQKAAIISQLAVLDSYIPRGLEDMWVATGFDTTKLPTIQQNRLAQKISLRAQLAAL